VSELHRSIGEVLALLRDEFPDVTISKIRFLESQGLVDPERTPSGYRRFYDKDIDRLRWILRQQRENYLPLKVIKDRLVGGDTADSVGDDIDAGDVTASSPAPRTPPAKAGAPPRLAELTGDTGASRRVLPEPSIFAARGSSPSLIDEAGASAAASSTAPASAAPSVVAPLPQPELHASARSDLTSVSMTAQELSDATGLRASDIAELERFGLVAHRSVGNVAVYDHEALVVARLAAGCRVHGLEPRHLRMFKVAADREAALFEQVVLPLARQRTVEARRALQDTLTDLSRLTDSLHSVLLQAVLRALD
jgi:DNA-binding transcriptional MerR regulator